MEEKKKSFHEKVSFLEEQLHLRQPAEQQLFQTEQTQQLRQQREVGPYQRLYDNFSPVPVTARIAGAQPVQENNLGRKERRKRKKAVEEELKQAKETYQALNKSADDGLIPLESVKDLAIFRTRQEREKWASKKLSHGTKTRGETMQDVARGDFSNFENLDKVMRNVVAGQAMRGFMSKYGDDLGSSSPEDLCQRIKRTGKGVSALMDPPLRLALSLAQKGDAFSEEQKEQFRRLDEAMSTAIMEETLLHHTTAEQLQTQLNGMDHHLPGEGADQARDAVAKSEAQQVQIAKRLMLLHMGQLKKIDGDGSPSDWDSSVSVAFSHCSRVAVTMPAQKSSSKEDKAAYDRMWKSVFCAKDGSNPAADNSRAASTHTIRRRLVSGGKTKEKKVLFNLIGQRGMNVAIGGLGNAGVNGKTLLNDGSCGHFYSMFKKGNTMLCGAILMGIESDSAGVTNQMGHTHDAKATGEHASSLGGQRTDEIGKKYGGRECDLKDIPAEEITQNMELLEDAMHYWQQGGQNDPEGIEAMKLLCGKTMKMDAFNGHFMDLIRSGAEKFRQNGGR